jgi:protein-tyrosine phosphatase
MDRFTGIRRYARGWNIEPPARLHTNIVFGSGKDLTPENVKKYNITHVINCAFDIDSPSWFRKKYPQNYVCMNAIDTLQADIRTWYHLFEQSMDKFRTDPASKTIYIHCRCGINRSGFLTLMYICKKFQYPFDNAVTAILRQRPSALTNTSFMKQAHEFLQ